MHIGVNKCNSGAAVFVDFPKNECNFLHKSSETKKNIVIGSSSSQCGALYEEFLSPVVVATIVLYETWRL